MIFDSEALNVIRSVKKIKISKRASIAVDNSIQLAVRTSLDSQLENDIERCRVMENIASNDFSTILEDLNRLLPSKSSNDIEIMQFYLHMLDEDETKLEASFLFYTSVSISLYMHFLKAVPIYQDTLTGKNPVSYSEYVNYQKLRAIFEDSYQRYEILKDDTDLPYDKAGEYIECMEEECSIFSRIHQSKTIDMDELIMHIDWSDSVEQDAFNKLFLPEVPVELRKSVLDYQKEREHRFDVLLSEILVNYELGLF